MYSQFPAPRPLLLERTMQCQVGTHRMWPLTLRRRGVAPKTTKERYVVESLRFGDYRRTREDNRDFGPHNVPTSRSWLSLMLATLFRLLLRLQLTSGNRKKLCGFDVVPSHQRLRRLHTPCGPIRSANSPGITT